MGKIVSIFNQKGGCGKSTSSTNLGSALALKGKKVLLTDFDAQANCTNAVGIDDEHLESTIYNLLTSNKVKKERILEVICRTSYEKLDILPSDITLSNAEITLSTAINRERILSRVLEQVRDDYEYIFIDCPPSLGLLSINALVASDYLIIPVSPSYFSVKGIKHLLDTVDLIRYNFRPELEIMGFLITMYDSRKNISKNIKEELERIFGSKVFNTIIRVNTQIEYAQDNQVPVIHYNQCCNGYVDYMALADEVIRHE